jgi:hypothetical protein
MKKIFFALCVFFVFTACAYAGEMYNCAGPDGKRIITDAPQDGMTDCVLKDSYDESSAGKKGKSRNVTGKSGNRGDKSKCGAVATNMNNARSYLNQAANETELEKGREYVGQAITYLNEAQTMSGLCECPSLHAQIARAAQYTQQANSMDSVSQFSKYLTKAISSFNDALEAFKSCQ